MSTQISSFKNMPTFSESCTSRPVIGERGEDSWTLHMKAFNNFSHLIKSISLEESFGYELPSAELEEVIEECPPLLPNGPKRRLRFLNWEVQIHPSSTVGELKEKLSATLDLEKRKIRVVFANKVLGGINGNEADPITRFGIENFSTVYVTCSHGGGGIGGFEFSNLSDAQYHKLWHYAPDWRVIDRGLNLEGRCDNGRCEAFNKRVWIQLGMGDFPNIGKNTFTSKCPLCKETAKDVSNVGFWNCRYVVEGRKIEPEEKDVIFEGEAEDVKHLLTFSSAQVKWAYLAIKTSPRPSKNESSGCVIV